MFVKLSNVVVAQETWKISFLLHFLETKKKRAGSTCESILQVSILKEMLEITLKASIFWGLVLELFVSGNCF